MSATGRGIIRPTATVPGTSAGTSIRCSVCEREYQHYYNSARREGPTLPVVNGPSASGAHYQHHQKLQQQQQRRSPPVDRAHHRRRRQRAAEPVSPVRAPRRPIQHHQQRQQQNRPHRHHRHHQFGPQRRRARIVDSAGTGYQQQQQQQRRGSPASQTSFITNLPAMPPVADNVLDLADVYHTTRLLGTAETGAYCCAPGCAAPRAQPTAVLKDVSARVYGGEVLAVLGSKGSGKRALLDVIAGRTARGETRGRITLNGAPLSAELFRRHGAYVSHRCYLLPSLTVRQTLTYATWLANLKHREARVRQTLADLALSQLANRSVAELTKPEYRRLMLGVQFAKDPLLLLLDEPTWDTDPLNTYLIVSMVWSYATRKGSIVILTMETPRSDVLPFVARVVFLCLGSVVYSGPTRSMLDYFTYVGFPCPELENPLMYYLCLSTVDRRSRDRYDESTSQITALVEKFKTEGSLYLKEAPATTIASSQLKDSQTPTSSLSPTPMGIPVSSKAMLSRGVKPGCFATFFALYLRGLAATFAFNRIGLKHFGTRILFLPLVSLFLSVHYLPRYSSLWQSRVFLHTSGFVFNLLLLFNIVGIVTTILLFPGFRSRYYQEKREGLYGGTMFIISYAFLSLPLSLISTLISAAALKFIFEFDLNSWYHVIGILWSSFVVMEQITVAVLMLIRRPLTAAVIVLYFGLVTTAIASGTLRSLRNLPEWLSIISLGFPIRYASLALNQLTLDTPSFQNLPYNDTTTCPGTSELCRYADGKAYLVERFTTEGDNVSQVFNLDVNLLISLAFSVGLILFNSVLYLLPLPSSVKAKFRE